MMRYKTTRAMSAVRQIWRSLLRKDKSVNKWRSILTDPSSAMLLHQQGKNVNELHSMLQELSISSRETFAFTLTLLTTKICVAENEDEFSYIRTVLEVFVLYSITMSDFAWMRGTCQNIYRSFQSCLLLMLPVPKYLTIVPDYSIRPS